MIPNAGNRTAGGNGATALHKSAPAPAKARNPRSAALTFFFMMPAFSQGEASSGRKGFIGARAPNAGSLQATWRRGFFEQSSNRVRQAAYGAVEASRNPLRQ